MRFWTKIPILYTLPTIVGVVTCFSPIYYTCATVPIIVYSVYRMVLLKNQESFLQNLSRHPIYFSAFFPSLVAVNHDSESRQFFSSTNSQGLHQSISFRLRNAIVLKRSTAFADVRSASRRCAGHRRPRRRPIRNRARSLNIKRRCSRARRPCSKSAMRSLGRELGHMRERAAVGSCDFAI